MEFRLYVQRFNSGVLQAFQPDTRSRVARYVLILVNGFLSPGSIISHCAPMLSVRDIDKLTSDLRRAKDIQSSRLI